MGGADTDVILARSGGGDGAAAIVGIGAGADDRRIADASPTLAGEAARRGRSGKIAVRVARHRADGTEMHVLVEDRARLRVQELLQLLPALLGAEIGGIDLFQAHFLGELGGARAPTGRASWRERGGQAG